MCCARTSMVMPRMPRPPKSVVAQRPAGLTSATNNRSSPWSTPVLPRSAGWTSWSANAGVVHLASLIDTTVEDFDRVIAINLRGAWLCTKHAAPRMIERGGGAIVNLSSLAGQVAVGGTGAYGMSKAGIIQLSRITAAELRSSGIRSNTLLPAFVDTPMQQTAMAMFDGALGAGGARSMIARLQGRMAAPEEMAGIVVFLLSDDASMITGTTQIADGGTIAALW